MNPIVRTTGELIRLLEMFSDDCPLEYPLKFQYLGMSPLHDGASVELLPVLSDARNLTASTAAIMLNVQPRTAFKWLEGGLLGGSRVSGQWKVSQVDVAKFCKEHGMPLLPGERT